MLPVVAAIAPGNGGSKARACAGFGNSGGNGIQQRWRQWWIWCRVLASWFSSSAGGMDLLLRRCLVFSFSSITRETRSSPTAPKSVEESGRSSADLANGGSHLWMGSAGLSMEFSFFLFFYIDCLCSNHDLLLEAVAYVRLQ